MLTVYSIVPLDGQKELSTNLEGLQIYLVQNLILHRFVVIDGTRYHGEDGQGEVFIDKDKSQVIVSEELCGSTHPSFEALAEELYSFLSLKKEEQQNLICLRLYQSEFNSRQARSSTVDDDDTAMDSEMSDEEEDQHSEDEASAKTTNKPTLPVTQNTSNPSKGTQLSNGHACPKPRGNGSSPRQGGSSRGRQYRKVVNGWQSSPGFDSNALATAAVSLMQKPANIVSHERKSNAYANRKTKTDSLPRPISSQLAVNSSDVDAESGSFGEFLVRTFSKPHERRIH
jgi:hypothetical protein